MTLGMLLRSQQSAASNQPHHLISDSDHSLTINCHRPPLHTPPRLGTWNRVLRQRLGAGAGLDHREVDEALSHHILESHSLSVPTCEVDAKMDQDGPQRLDSPSASDNPHWRILQRTKYQDSVSASPSLGFGILESPAFLESPALDDAIRKGKGGAPLLASRSLVCGLMERFSQATTTTGEGAPGTSNSNSKSKSKSKRVPVPDPP
mmetsp:Transcript_12291/g.35522  ORF Transcript_12291/g.35522 Transcript_12291/m.35522 type:complete len:206 (-) Transcript_12291:37-654(-)